MKEQEQPKDQSPTNQEVKTSRRPPALRWFRRIFFVLFGVFVLANALVLLPAFQNWAVNTVAQSLSDRLETTVKVDYLYFSFFDKLQLKGLYLQGVYGDTLLYSNTLRADLNLNPIVLLTRGLEVEAVKIKGARFLINRPLGQAETNLEYALQRLFPPREKPRNPFRMNLRLLELEDVQFIERDSLRGNHNRVHLSRGEAYLRQLDLPGKFINISSLTLDRPVIQLEKLPLDTLDLPIADTTEQREETADSTKLALRIERFALSGGQFKLDNFKKAPQVNDLPNRMDWKHLDFRDINIDIEQFELRRDTFTGQVGNIQLQATNGFQLRQFSVEDAVVSPQEVTLNGLQFITPNSQIGDTLRFTYNQWLDWTDFVNRVRLDTRLNGAQITLQDIMTFVPTLYNNPFFNSNQATVVQLDGRLRGPIDKLRGQNIRLALSDGSLLEGNFNTRNLTRPNEEVVNFELDRLRTRMQTLRQLIPNFNPPVNFNRLGRLDFSGRFDGFFQDFVAYGDLRTDIGRAELDMRMNLKPGQRRATYSGSLSVNQFDLGAWTANPNFGLVSFRSSVNDGRGLVAETASADVTGTIDLFTFKNYPYQNAQIAGRLNDNFFDGDFLLRDENIDFTFSGRVDFRDSIPSFDFEANVEKLDLQAINLSEEKLVMAGAVELNLKNTRISDLEGQLRVEDFDIVKSDTESYHIQSVYLFSEIDSDGRKRLNLESDVAVGAITGSFDFNELPRSIQQFAARNYPEFAARMNIEVVNELSNENSFQFDFDILDSKGLNYLISPKLGRLENADISGGYDGVKDSLAVALDLPAFRFGDLTLIDLALNLQAEQSEGNLSFHIDSIAIKEKNWLSDLHFISLLEGDTIDFSILCPQKRGFQDTIDYLEMDGLFYPTDTNHYQVRLEELDLQILDEKWIIEPGNVITFGKRFIDVQDFVLRNGKRRAQIQKFGEEGLRLDLTDFSFTLIDRFWDYKQLDFNGQFDVRVQVRNLFDMEGLRAAVEADSFFINQDDYGALRLDLETENLKNSPLLGLLSITRDTTQLQAELQFNINDLEPSKGAAQLAEKERKNYVSLGIDIAGYPLAFGNYWIGETVSDVEGNFNANVRIKGFFPDPRINGYIRTNGGALTINYLQTRYQIKPYSIIINDNLFSLKGLTLLDKNGREAIVARGGVTHDHFRDMGLDVLMRVYRFLALDLEKGDNELFYGRAMGTGIVEFTGNFVRPDIAVTAIVGDSTEISIPVASGAEASDLSNFVKFVDRRAEQERAAATKEERRGSTGVSLEMNLAVGEEAEMELIFDEKAGDIIRGSGRGNLRILVPRDEDFQMFGDYTISEGNYLFTLYNVVNKDFSVKPGGRIVWTGDPFGAQVSLVAEYKELRAPVRNFIAEYLQEASPDVREEATRPTAVDLSLMLEGNLLQPDINFDIDMPNLTGRLETLVENKRRQLQNDPNELNRQVFGLIVSGQFLPSDFSFGQPQSVVFNTLSEFASNQLSLLLTGLFQEVFGEDNVLSGVDFNVAYNQYSRFDGADQQGSSSGNQFEVTVQQKFANDRLSIQLGGNVIDDDDIVTRENGVFVGNDLIIEYSLNEFRTLKLRLYQRLQPDIGGGTRLQIGTGLSWRKEFDSFSDFLNGMKKDTQRAAGRKRNSKTPSDERPLQ